MADKAQEQAKAMADKMKNMKVPKGGPVARMGAGLLVGTGLLGLGIYNSMYTVPGGHKAIEFNRVVGLKDTINSEGLKFCIPWFEWPIIYDVRTRPRVVSSVTGSRDLQMVHLSVRILSKPNENELPYIYRLLGAHDYDERVLPSIVNEVCKQVAAQFNASQLLTQRELVRDTIYRELQKRARDFQLIINDVSIIDLKFGREFTHAVEAKQVAEQHAERAKFLVDKALQEKRSIVIRAQGEAKSAELIGKAISNNPGFVELRRIDAAKDVANIVTRGNNKVFLDTESLMLNLMGGKKAETVAGTNA